MFDARRPLGWLFLLLPAMVALAVSAQEFPTTSMSDTVYRADGTPARRRDAGDFMAGVHHRRPGGSRRGQWQRHAWDSRRVIGRLDPNANATPANTIYSVV
jgi:hypothetical protein